jgi:hypothetical protein
MIEKLNEIRRDLEKAARSYCTLQMHCETCRYAKHKPCPLQQIFGGKY